jgi:hypothetical protein
MRELMKLLPSLSVDADGELEFSRSEPNFLRAIAENAEESATALNRGMSAVGSLIAYSTPEIEDGTIAYDAIESLGWLFAELGAVTAICLELSAQCRRAAGRAP